MIVYLSARSGISDSRASDAQNLMGGTIRRRGDEIVALIDADRAIDMDRIDVNKRDENAPKPRLFLADMDSTMIGQECIDELADFAGVEKQVASITERAMQGELGFEASLRERVALLEGLDEAALQRAYDERVSVNDGARELLAALGNAGVRRVLVSGGFTFFASRVAETLGFDRYVANEFEITKGKLTGQVAGSIVGRETKSQILAEEASHLSISMAEAATIGDGANDLAMIEAAGTGIAYRAKPVLRDAAQIRLDHSDLDVLGPILGL